MGNTRNSAEKGLIRNYQTIIFFLISVLLIFNSCTKEKIQTENKQTVDEAVHQMEAGRYDSSIAIYRMLINQLDSVKDCLTAKIYRIAISDLYRQMGKFELAGNLLESIDTLNCMNEDSRREYYLIRSKIDFDTRNYQPALSNVNIALEISEKKFSSNSEQTAECFSLIGKCYLSINNYPEAKKYFELSYSVKKNLKADKKEFIPDFMNFGLYYLALGEYDQALKNFNSGLSSMPARADETYDLNKSSLLNGIGIVYYQLSDFEKALKNMNDALKIRERILSPSHYLTADIYGNLGMVYLGYAEPEIAYDLYEKALNTRIKVFGEDNITVARTYNNLAGACKELDKYDEAESY
ncbi:MAG TPA: tetratricopeptide repeat protein, partial [Ignavibacteriaceae bacterium]|nr:tetratricopeptide repeat protein [Ignavibacteriaceae bacterium]